MVARYLSPSGAAPRDDRLPVDLFSLQGVPDPQNAFILLPPIVGVMICMVGNTHPCVTLAANLLYQQFCHGRLNCPFVFLVMFLLVPSPIHYLVFVLEVSLESPFQ